MLAHLTFDQNAGLVDLGPAFRRPTGHCRTSLTFPRRAAFQHVPSRIQLKEESNFRDARGRGW
jgi:hypothetical protein